MLGPGLARGSHHLLSDLLQGFIGLLCTKHYLQSLLGCIDVTFVLNTFITGKEKVSPGRTSDPNPAAPDSESVIVAMERVSVLFDR